MVEYLFYHFQIINKYSSDDRRKSKINKLNKVIVFRTFYKNQSFDTKDIIKIIKIITAYNNIIISKRDKGNIDKKCLTMDNYIYVDKMKLILNDTSSFSIQVL